MRKINWLNLFLFSTTLFTILLGLVIAWVTGQVSRLSCQWIETQHIDCRLQRHFLGFIPAGERELNKVSGVELREDCFDDCTYWVEVSTEAGSVSLTRFGVYSRNRMAAEAQHVADFLNDSDRKTLEHVSPPAWLGFFAGLFLIVVGGVLGYFKYGGR